MKTPTGWKTDLFLENHRNKKDVHRPDSSFDGPITSPSSIWSPFVKKTILRVILNNTVLRVVIKTSTCDPSGGLRRLLFPKK